MSICVPVIKSLISLHEDGPEIESTNVYQYRALPPTSKISTFGLRICCTMVSFEARGRKGRQTEKRLDQQTGLWTAILNGNSLTRNRPFGKLNRWT